MSVNDIKLLIRRALEHYEMRLKEMQSDQDVLKLGIDIVKNDLETNVKSAESTRRYLGETLRASLIPPDEREIICIALACYIDDLKSTIQTTKTKLGNLNISFEEINMEINKADDIRTKICTSD